MHGFYLFHSYIEVFDVIGLSEENHQVAMLVNWSSFRGDFLHLAATAEPQAFITKYRITPFQFLPALGSYVHICIVIARAFNSNKARRACCQVMESMQ